MLTIRIANIAIPLHDQSLSVVLTSPFPFMAQGQHGGNYIFNFKVGATDELKKAFRFAHRPGTKDKPQLPFFIDAYGLRYSGLASLTEAGADTYEVMCPLGNGDFNSRARDIKLPELDLGGDLSTVLNPLVAHSSVNYIFSSTGPGFYTEEKVIAFDIPIANTAQLNASGTAFTSNATQYLAFKFDLISQIEAGRTEIHVYKNGIFDNNLPFSRGSARVINNIMLLPGDVVTWRLYIESRQGFGIGLMDFGISGTLFRGSKLTVAQRLEYSSIKDAATKRYPEINYAVFPVHNPFAFDKWPDDQFSVDNQSIKNIYSNFIRVMNYWYNNDFPASITINGEDDEQFTAGNIFVPFPYVAFIIQRIASRFGFRIQNNVFDDELKYAVLINFFLENAFIDETILEANSSIFLNDHVPDWSVYDFLQHICKLFGLGYEVNNESNTISFTFVKDLLEPGNVYDIGKLVVSRPRADWNNNPEAFSLQQKYPTECKLAAEIKPLTGINIKGAVANTGDLPLTADLNDAYLVVHSDSYWVWAYNPDTYRFEFVFHSRRYTTEISSGKDAPTIETELAAAVSMKVFDIVQPLSLNRLWTLPASHQPAQFEGAPDVYKGEWKPLVCWYHGLKNDSLGQPYPYASADMIDYAGNEIPGVPFSLKLEGARGTYNILWREYLLWRTSAKPVRVSIMPDRAFLRNFRFSQKVRFGGMNYLIAELRGNITANGPGVFELLLLAV